MEAFDTWLDGRRGISCGSTSCYRLLRESGILGPKAPPTLRHLRTAGQQTPEQMIDRYHLACRPARDLLLDYLHERRLSLEPLRVRDLGDPIAPLTASGFSDRDCGVSRNPQ
ncbi:MAG: hypothetical protein ACYDAQ_08045 [Mycobacteriales bacterium]